MAMLFSESNQIFVLWTYSDRNLVPTTFFGIRKEFGISSEFRSEYATKVFLQKNHREEKHDHAERRNIVSFCRHNICTMIGQEILAAWTVFPRGTVLQVEGMIVVRRNVG